MNETAWLIVAGVVVAILIAAVVIVTVRRRNTERLKSRFGSEYARTVDETGDAKLAETELRDREARVKEFRLKQLSEADRTRLTQSWRNIQGDFVDDPAGAFTHADELIIEAMAARGYPTTDFDQRSADLSVEHPEVVQNYRKGHEIAVRHADGQAGTEELRQGMVSYRSLFNELIGETTARSEVETPPAPPSELPSETPSEMPAGAPSEAPSETPTEPNEIPHPASAQGR